MERWHYLALGVMVLLLVVSIVFVLDAGQQSTIIIDDYLPLSSQ